MKLWYLITKLIRDLISTLYDDNNFKIMSLPRVILAVSSICVVTAWISNQFYKIPFDHFSELITWFGVCAGGYVAKKFIDNRGKNCNGDLPIGGGPGQ